MIFNGDNHTFVVCAYKESPYLEDCINSLLEQTIKSNIIISTSTPNSYIKNISIKFQLELYINYGEKGIAEDWNFGYAQVHTDLITLAHQDDIYNKTYLENILIKINKAKNPLIAFTDYNEIRNGVLVKCNQLLLIKRTMLVPLQSRVLQKRSFVRRIILSFGSPICCPSVTYVKRNLPEIIFKSEYRSDVDWQAWEKLSVLKGEFIYCNKALIYHRIHGESATTEIIADNDRSKEDLEMFSRFWPKRIAKLLASFYSKSENSNKIK